jgi:hypothetical protein
MLTLKEAKSAFKYNPETGDFVRISTNKKTGSTNIKNGYVYLTLNKKHHLAHRVAWLIVYGEWPNGLIDHDNRNKTDNRICNLRIADKTTNGTNRSGGYSSTGYRGIYVQSNTNKYRVRIKNIHYGYFNTLEEAITVAQKAIQTMYGEFAGVI